MAPNEAATSAAALAADPTGFDHVFYRVRGGAVFQRTFRDGTWSGASSLGGAVVGAPSVALARTTLVVAVRGTDGALWTRTGSHGTWGGWQKVPGVLSAAPAVVGASDGRIDVFVRGGDDALWTKTLPFGGTWSSWRNLGGRLATGPAAVTFGSGRIDVVVAGTDHKVWTRSLAGGTWSGWRSLGGRTYSAPSAARSAGTEGLTVVVRGTDNALDLATRTGGGWSGWQRQPGVLVDAPAAVGTASGGVDLVVRGSDAALWTKLLRNGSLSGWRRAWAPVAAPPPAGSLLRTDWTRVPTDSKVVALTFDAGANADGVPSIRATLSGRNVPATFFLTGSWVRGFPARANEITVGGFLVGNHSDTHPYFTILGDTQVAAEVRKAWEAIWYATGADSRPLFRFPYGNVDARVLADVNDLGYAAVRWTTDSLGWRGTSGGMSVQKVVDRVMADLRPGQIVLMHVGSNPDDHTTLDAQALPTIIDRMRARGYTFVTLPALTG
ncbi:MAG TPA: polysaccharide deacetylase family protein [Frankiaceae bacterium]|nr:polysaccharide deacetylase family protein [Frankiaceae bacterium]